MGVFTCSSYDEHLATSIALMAPDTASRFLARFLNSSSTLLTGILEDFGAGCGDYLVASFSGCAQQDGVVVQWDYRNMPDLDCPQRCRVGVSLANGTMNGYISAATCTNFATQV